MVTVSDKGLQPFYKLRLPEFKCCIVFVLSFCFILQDPIEKKQIKSPAILITPTVVLQMFFLLLLILPL